MKRIIIKWIPAQHKRVYLVQSRRWCFSPWETEGSYVKRDKAVDAYLEDELRRGKWRA